MSNLSLTTFPVTLAISIGIHRLEKDFIFATGRSSMAKKTEMQAEEVKAKASTRKKSKTNTRDTRAAVETASTHASKLNTMLLFHIGIIAFLVLNAFLSISLLLRVNQLTERNRLGN